MWVELEGEQIGLLDQRSFWKVGSNCAQTQSSVLLVELGMSLDMKSLLVAIIEQISIFTTKIIFTPLFATHPDSDSDQFLIFRFYASACLADQTPHLKPEDEAESTQHKAS